MNHSLHSKALLRVRNYKRSESELLAILAEIDRTKVFLEFGVPSLFAYCVQKLSLSESETSRFITVTRKCVEVPALKKAIDEGMLTVSKAARITSVITPGTTQEDGNSNAAWNDSWISKASTLTHRELEREIVKVDPKVIRREGIRVKTPDVSELRVNVSKDLERKLERVKEVLRAKSFEETLEKMTDMILKQKDPVEKATRVLQTARGPESQRVPKAERKHVARVMENYRQPKAEREKKGQRISKRRSTCSTQPQALTKEIFQRYIKATLKHQVYIRDQGKCQYKNCRSSHWVELHHIKPVSQGGVNELSNLTTFCSSHHSLMHHFQKSSYKTT